MNVAPIIRVGKLMLFKMSWGKEETSVQLQGLGNKCSCAGTRKQVFRSRDQETSVQVQVPEKKCSGAGTRKQVFRCRDQETSVQELGP